MNEMTPPSLKGISPSTDASIARFCKGLGVASAYALSLFCVGETVIEAYSPDPHAGVPAVAGLICAGVATWARRELRQDREADLAEARWARERETSASLPSRRHGAAPLAPER